MFDEIVAKDGNAVIGTDNMSAILINLINDEIHWSRELLQKYI